MSRTGAKVSAIVDAITALRAKLGGGNESPIVTKSGGAGIVRPESSKDQPSIQLARTDCHARSLLV